MLQHLEGGRLIDMAEMASSDYEALAEYVVTALTDGAPVTTIKIERDVRVQGKATTHQIDVLWEFQDGEHQCTVLFECRSYKRRLTQGAVLGWRGVVQDITSVRGDCEGVMLTSTGYQSGARDVADTYGIVILELRAPTDKDLAGRVQEIHLSIVARVPFVRDVQVEADEVFGDLGNGQVTGLSTEILLVHADGRRERLTDVLLTGELGLPVSVTGEPHTVLRRFSTPPSLMVEGRRLMTVRAVRATVGETVEVPQNSVIGGREQLAWMLKNTLDGTHAWFTEDGRPYITD